MHAAVYSWSELPTDHPIPLLDRSALIGGQMLVARVTLHPGCVVQVHRHASEQVAIILSGRVRWTLGEDARIVEAGTGDVVHLPANVPHGVEAIEETHIIDVLAPPGPMGIDNQGRGH